ncbi:phospholipase D family protein [Dietzia sp. SL131]|uniref:phospholipase D family protein n=1 Tax=Dietzia sp. SL131 TaxID=2995149 RepID=UPI00227BE8CE|nr:phospholipase D family protein [Dietzia sp. SL131]MCY1657431.1 phospholipase D family protein [Dietzia sp. SL131]
MILLSQPSDGQLGEYLSETLESGEFDTLSVVVAFAKNNGVLRLRESMRRFRDSGGDLHFYVGLDMNGTSYEALVNLLAVATSLRVIHDENGQTFHTKLYNFEAPERSVLVVGSHNFTAGGLWSNFETSIRLSLESGTPDHLQMRRSVDAHLKRLRALTDTTKLIENEEDIHTLLSNQYVEKEVKTQIRRRQAAEATAPGQPLFGTGPRAYLPSLPRISPTAQEERTTVREKSVTAPGEPEIVREEPAKVREEPRTVPEESTIPVLDANKSGDPTLWLETRKMTGGSRNILDLSKTSLLHSGDVAGTHYEHTEPGFMRGAVEFFGVDPENTAHEKEIVINFEGIDYFGNTIKFPEGEHANGTWRVQIKGKSADGVRITKVFSELASGGYFLPQKIVTFTRVRDDYYYLSVFSESDLNDFVDAAVVTAYNGRTQNAKLLGIF